MLRFSQAPEGVVELHANHCMLPKSCGICSPVSPLPRSASGFTAAGAETRSSSGLASLAFPAHFPEVNHPLPTTGLLSCSFPPAPSTQHFLGGMERNYKDVLQCRYHEFKGEIYPVLAGPESWKHCSNPAALEEPRLNVVLAISGCWQLFLALTPRSVLFSSPPSPRAWVSLAWRARSAVYK